MHDITISPIVLIIIGLLCLGLLVFMFIRHKKTGERNADLREKNKRLMAIGNIYYSMHIINLREDNVQEVNATDLIRKYVPSNSITYGAKAIMHNIISEFVVEEQLEDALAFTDLSTLAERMKDEKTFFHEFQTKISGWLRGRFIVIDRDENGLPINVILATVIVDKERKKEEGLIQISRTDELTGISNRRAYEEKIDEYESNIPEDLVIVSMDLNGLKVANDSKGHAAGDEMIVGAAESIRECFSEYGEVYRTGGDEFAAIIRCNSESLVEIKSKLPEIVSKWKGKLVDSISVSAGYVTKAEMPEASIHEMIVKADSNMNKAKGEYYRSRGVDRRGQRDAHTALCQLYTKILKINITEDTYQIVNMSEDEKTSEKGFADTISGWLKGFALSGQVHPEDVEYYLEQTDKDHIIAHFDAGNKSWMIFYRRKINNEYKTVMMEIIPANDYKQENKSLYLYVKNIEKNS